MKKNNLMRTLKNWFAFIITLLLCVVLFGVIFVSLDIAKPDATFFTELGIVTSLTVLMRFFWYDFAEDKRLNEDDLIQKRDAYFKMIDNNITDSNDLDKFLIILNQENREHYIKNKIGSRTAKNMAKKTKLLCFFHPSYRKMSKEDIGQLRYTKLYFRVQRKADKLKQITSEEIMALSENEVLYDSRNHRKDIKKRYQILSTIGSTLFTILLASIAFKEIMLNWLNVFRYVTYLFSMLTTICMTVVRAYRVTGDETIDWYNRLMFIVDKYASYKETQKEVVDNGELNRIENTMDTSC